MLFATKMLGTDYCVPVDVKFVSMSWILLAE